MIRMSKLNASATDISSYFCSTENYYYSQLNNIQTMLKESGFQVTDLATLEHVRLYGKLTERMGYKSGQPISQKTFADLLEGKNFEGMKICREHKVKAIDITFSAPKSVSIAALITNNITRKYQQKILEAHNKAVLETMHLIESKYSYAQPRAGEDVKSTGMCWVQVNDGFNREHDPHLHTHVIVFNITEYQNRFMALRTRELFQNQVNQFCGAYYRQILASELKKLGLNFTYIKGGEFRLNLISRELEKEFSTRRQQIQEAKNNGASDLDAWRQTRKDKNPTIDKVEIIADCYRRFDKYPFKSEQENKKESEEERQKWSKEAEWSIEAEQERNGFRENTTEDEKWQLAAERATQQTAVATKEAIMREYMYELIRSEKGQSVSMQELEDRFAKQLRKGYVLEVKGGYTTVEYALLELDYFRRFNEKIFNLVVDKKTAERFLKSYEKKQKYQNRHLLSKIQREAVSKMLQSDKMITVVQGDAGSGKTTALRAIGEFYKERGVEVVGLCMQGVAARNLEQETGIKSYTLRSFLEGKGKSGDSRVIIFDEASMLDSRNAARLFNLAKEKNDKIILVGDVNQLESIGAGKVFQRAVELRERENKLIRLNENFRQRDKELRKAVDHARCGRMKECHEILEKNNRIIEISDEINKKDDRDLERKSKIAKEYNERTLIITGSSASRDKLNLIIRENLKNEGKLTHERIYKIGILDKDGVKTEIDRPISKGEIIVFCKNEYKEYDIRNGERAKVIDTKLNALVVKTEDGRKLEINLDKYNTIDYGYALTTYKSQGQTYDKVIIEAETNYKKLNDMRNQYVYITRARDEIKIFTNDKEELKELSKIRTEKTDTIGEKFTQQELNKLKHVFISGIISEKIRKLHEQQHDLTKTLGRTWELEL